MRKELEVGSAAATSHWRYTEALGTLSLAGVQPTGTADEALIPRREKKKLPQGARSWTRHYGSANHCGGATSQTSPRHVRASERPRLAALLDQYFGIRTVISFRLFVLWGLALIYFPISL